MNNSKIIFGSILIFLGLSTLLRIDIWPIFWPLVLIFFGLRIMSRGSRNNINRINISETKQDSLDEVVIFSGIERKIMSNNFKGGKMVMIFGGGTLDLGQSTSELEKIKLEVVAIFGGLKLIVPKNWKVESDGVAIIGGFDNHTSDPEKKTNTLHLNGTAIFGGVEIVD